jgi:D-glycero-D-manno-heptose 1,7-bisphosphate phosphatase
MGIGGVMQRAVFLDRDGVINKAVVRDGKPYPPGRVEDVEIYEDVPEALKQLKAAGFLCVLVTNQPDVARGKQVRGVVEAIHEKLMASLPLDDCLVCYHDDEDGCACRKPAPGMLFMAAERLGISLKDSFMIGDRWRDIEAGRRAGCQTVWIDRKYSEPLKNKPDFTAESLLVAVEWILRKTSQELR